MKYHSSKIALAIVLSIGGVDAASAVTDFSGYYDVSNWATSDTASGSVNTSVAPSSIALTSGDSGAAGDTDFSLTILAASSISFNWSYDTSDVWPELDPFGYLVNGVFTPLVSVGDLTPLTHQSGSLSVLVAVGDVFGFRAETFDGFGGPAVTTISNFTAQDAAAVPIPAAAWLFGSVLALVPWLRRKRAGAV